MGGNTPSKFVGEAYIIPKVGVNFKWGGGGKMKNILKKGTNSFGGVITTLQPTPLDYFVAFYKSLEVFVLPIWGRVPSLS